MGVISSYKFRDDAARAEPAPVPTDAEILRSFIEKERLTQKSFAEKLRVSLGAVSQWLSGKRKVPGYVLAYIELYRAHKFMRAMFDSRSGVRA